MSQEHDIRIRPVRLDDWPQVRDTRLEMLKDTPGAYVERYEDALALTEDDWRARTERGAQGATATKWVAETTDGRWIGTLGAFVEIPGEAWVVAVYVNPAHRGRARGITDRLLDAAIGWARNEADVDRLLLEVREDNARARAFYRRRGFTETGQTAPYPLDPAYREIEMELRMR